MEMTKQYNSLIDVYRPRIDRICNIEKNPKSQEIVSARKKKDDHSTGEEQYTNSYSMASIIESQLEKQRKLAGRRADLV